jgi:DNA polymerase elongation subunit (family B)
MNELDSKLATLFGNNEDNYSRKQGFVHRIDEFIGTQFYGYHPSQETFIRILFYNPYFVVKASELLSSKRLSSLSSEPFQSHIPYILQFFIDYNISGMNFIIFENGIERREELDPSYEQPIGGKPQLKKMTTCQVELDCRAIDILNARPGSELKSGLQLIWNEEEERCRRSGREFLAKPQASQVREKDKLKIFKREADFLSILDKICNEAPCSQGSTVLSSGSSKESEELMEELKRLVMELATENCTRNESHNLNSSQNNNRYSPVAGPSHLFEDIGEDFCLSDFEEDEEVNRETDDLVTHEMSQRLTDVLTLEQLEDGNEDNNILGTLTEDNCCCSTFTVGNSVVLDGNAVIPGVDDFGADDTFIEQQLACLDTTEEVNNESGTEWSDSDGELEAVLAETSFSPIPQVDGSSEVIAPKEINQKKELNSSRERNTTQEVYNESGTEWSDSDGELEAVLAETNFSPIPQVDGSSELIVPKEINHKKELNSSRKRVKRLINGQRLSVPVNISDQELEQLSQSFVLMNAHVASTSKETPAKQRKRRPSSTSQPLRGHKGAPDVRNLTGKAKTEYLLSLCQPLEVPLVEIDIAPNVFNSTSENNILTDTQILSNASTEIIDMDGEEIPTQRAQNGRKIIDVDDEGNKSDDEKSEGVFSFYGNQSHESFSRVGSILGESDGEMSSQLPTSFNPPITSTQIPNHSTPCRPKQMSNVSHSQYGVDSPSLVLPAIADVSPVKTTSRIKIFTAEEYLEKEIASVVDQPPKSSRPKAKRNFRNRSCSSVIAGATQSQLFDFAVHSQGDSLDERITRCSPHEFQLVTILSMELHVDTRNTLNPDPCQDGIRALFYSFYVDEPSYSEQLSLMSGIIVVDEIDMDEIGDISQRMPRNVRSTVFRSNVKVTHANGELDLITKFIEVLRNIDPDIILGYEVEMSSWGYLIERGNFLNMQLNTAVSRLIEDKSQFAAQSTKISSGNMHYFTGRILLNLWRLLRKEVTLNLYSYENCHFHILHETVPKYTFQELTRLFNEQKRMSRWKVLEYHVRRVEGNLRMIDKLRVIPKVSTLARVYGIQFSEVLSRGSQFRVESMLLRYTKNYQFIPFSPTPRQRTSMDAPEYIPLVMEPESAFYTDPVVVLDFQSLYPSMMIAYNYCFSSCLGKVMRLNENGPFKFGCSSLDIPKSLLKKIRKHIHISPSGTAFVTQDVRQGVLPEMLHDILETRLMVKSAMKANMSSGNKSKSLNSLLDARQLALKLVANVTYGYTAANFSGRMPCVEIADAIVSKGKETLQRAIELVNSNKRKWGGKVVYGDTDSLFIHFPGCSKEDAFERGHEIANAVTDQNPKPVKLKFERVLYPSVLLAKKRYVGYEWESLDQEKPKFLAKGIETVRRDNCNATGKLLEKALKTLFETKKTEEVKSFIQKQFSKILTGKISHIQDFIFAKEYRGMDSYSAQARVPSLELTKKMMLKDPRSEPRRGERVPYVIVCGSPNQNIIELVHHPMDLIRNPCLRINTNYYIERVIIPPLNRVFSLLQQDVMKWLLEMPHRTRLTATEGLFSYHGRRKQVLKNQTTISQFFSSSNCVCCGKKLPKSGLCFQCKKQSQETAISLNTDLKNREKKFRDTLSICKSCTRDPLLTSCFSCENTTCCNLFRVSQANVNFDSMNTVETVFRSLETLEF